MQEPTEKPHFSVLQFEQSFSVYMCVHVMCVYVCICLCRSAAETKGCSVTVAYMGAPTSVIDKMKLDGGYTALHVLRQLIASGVCEPENGDGKKDYGVVKVTPNAEHTVWRADGYQSVDITKAPPVGLIRVCEQRYLL